MSTTLWVTALAPPAIDAVIASLDRADQLALAEGSAWPTSVLVYRRGASSRGVQVSHDGAKVALRLLALSAPADYELAFALAERLGGDGVVEVEAGEAVPAREVRARLGGAWMVRDMAVGVTAVRTALETGGTVHIDGPVRGLEITPAALATTQPLEMIEILRRAQAETEPRAREERPEDPQAKLDDAHVEALRAEEEALPPLPAVRRSWAWLVFGALTLLVLGPPALIVRLLTWPLRGWLRDRADARRDRRRASREQRVAEARAKNEAEPDTVARRVDAALITYAAGKLARADRELAAIVREHDDHALAWHNLAVMRDRLRLPRLSKAAAARAKSLGHVAKRPARSSTYAAMLGEIFVGIAGLAPD